MPTPKAVSPVFETLSREFPSPRTELLYKNEFELLIAVILSAQCTDAQVNLSTPNLFKKYPTPQAMARGDLAEIEKLVHSCGFYRMKAKAIQQTSRDLVEKFKARVPNTLEDLVTLSGVGRKMASVVLNQAFDQPAIAVDTHVKRVAHRLGWTENTDPVKIEFDLRDLLPIDLWGLVNGLLILHGRKTCKARKPLCESCSVKDYCRFYGNQQKLKKPKKR